MHKAFPKFCAVLFLLIAPCFGQQQRVNPTSQINWPKTTGSGSPTASCTSANYGQPYTDSANNVQYTCGSSGWFAGVGGGLNPGSQTQLVNYANSGTDTVGGPTQITTDTATHSNLNVPGLFGASSSQGVENPGYAIDNTCATDVHAAIQAAINGSGVDFAVPPGCYNLGAVGITIPSTIMRFSMSPAATFQCTGATVCVQATGVGSGPSTPSEFDYRVNVQNSAINWIPQGIITGVTYSGGLTPSGTGTCPLTSFNNDPSGLATATLNITSGAVTSITLTSGGKHATTPSTTATVGTCTGTASVTGTITLTTTLNSVYTAPEDTSSIGFSCNNCGSYELHVSATHFWKGFQLLGTNAGSTEDHIFGGNFQDNFISLAFDQSGSGFTNQNQVYKGQYRINGGSTCPGGVPVVGTTYFQLNGGNNGNLFTNNELQGQCVWRSLDNFGGLNTFISVRFESALPGSIVFEAGTSDHDNYMMTSLLPAGLYSPSIVDLGTANKFDGSGIWQDFNDAAFNTIQITDSATINSATYQGGLTPSGADGTTCILTFAGGSPHAIGTASLLGGTIPVGATVTMTSGGTEYLGTAPTTATGSNGTATGCPGTATVASVIGKTSTFGFNQRSRTLTIGDGSMGSIVVPSIATSNATVGGHSVLVAGSDIVVAPATTWSDTGNINSLNLRIQGIYPGVGIASGSYISGGTGACTGTGTAILNTFNFGSTATATVPVIAGVITVGTITVTNNGTGATAASTTATINTGTGVTCTPTTVNIATVRTSAIDQITSQVQLGTGNNPTSSFFINHTGSLNSNSLIQYGNFGTVRFANQNVSLTGADSPAPNLQRFGQWLNTSTSTAQNASMSWNQTFIGPTTGRTVRYTAVMAGTAPSEIVWPSIIDTALTPTFAPSALPICPNGTDGAFTTSGCTGATSGTTASIGGSPLAAGACATGTATLTGIATGTPLKTPSPTSAPSAPGAGFISDATMTSSGTATVSVCAIVAGTPTASTYTVSN